MGTARLTQLVLDADRLLRYKSLDGTRVQVTAEQMATELNVTVEAAKQALTALVRVDKSGLSTVRGIGFEYIVPSHYPDRLNQMQHTLNKEAAAADSEASKSKVRGQLTAEVLTWCRANPDLMPCHISHVAKALDAEEGSVGQSLLKLARNHILVQRPNVGRGWYGLRVEVGDLYVRVAEDDPADAIYDEPEPPAGVAEAIMIDQMIAEAAMHNGGGVPLVISAQPKTETDLKETFLGWLESSHSADALTPRQWFVVQEAFEAGFNLGQASR